MFKNGFRHGTELPCPLTRLLRPALWSGMVPSFKVLSLPSPAGCFRTARSTRPGLLAAQWQPCSLRVAIVSGAWLCVCVWLYPCGRMGDIDATPWRFPGVGGGAGRRCATDVAIFSRLPARVSSSVRGYGSGAIPSGNQNKM